MRQRVLFSDLTTLYVCPTKRWGTLERKALSDCLIQRDFGGNPIIFCIKGSKLHSEALKWDIRTIHYTGKRVNRLIDIRYFLDVRKIFRQNNFDVVHCYDLDFLWVISLLLLARPEIPLLLTFNSYLYTAQREFWQKWLFKRVDQVLVFGQTMKELVQETLPVSNRKVKISGNGVDAVRKIPHGVDNERHLGCILVSFDDLRQAHAIVYALMGVLSSELNLNFQVKLKIYHLVSIENWPLYKDLIDLIEKNHLVDHVEFKMINAESEAFKSLDIFIGTAFNEPFNDYEVTAILSKIPVIIPRTASRQYLLNKHKWTGESYHEADARELKAKILKILSNDRIYINELEDQNEAFSENHGLDAYVNRLCGFYERNYSKRLRYSRVSEK